MQRSLYNARRPIPATPIRHEARPSRNNVMACGQNPAFSAGKIVENVRKPSHCYEFGHLNSDA